jgi:prepilin-type N-terminal cleavage/methylation domain-containing protein
MRTHLRAGFTLVELMVAMALTLFIMVILSQAFVLSLETFSAMKGLGDMQINLRVATSLLRDDLSQDHFEGKRRLSDVGPTGVSTFIGQPPLIPAQPPQAGFFAVLQRSAASAAGGYITEGTDTNGLASYRANNHVLYMTVKRRGNRPENFFTVSGVPAAFFGQNTAYDVTPTNLAYDTLAQPINTGFYNSQWAEVVYYLVQAGSTEEPNNPASTIGTPTFGLYRAQYVMVPDGTNVSGKFNGALAATTYQGFSCGQIAGKVAFYSPVDASKYVVGQTPVVKRTDPLLAQFAQPAAGTVPNQVTTTLVLPSVISFQIQVMPTGTTAFIDVPPTGSSGHLFDTAMFSAPPGTYGNDFGLKAIQITLRVWDNKTRQTRQVTVVQDL